MYTMNILLFRPLLKGAYQKGIFFYFSTKHMLWLLKTYVKTDVSKHVYYFTLKKVFI